jgi:hypothetical protein
VRSSTLSLREQPFVEAARAVGMGELRIAVRHVLPNTLAPLIVLATAQIGSAILVEASVSFLGLGSPEPHPSWGRMLSESAAEYVRTAPWLVVFPGVAISLTVFGTNLLGDALRSGNSAGMPPDPALVRSPRERYGVALNLEQELSASVDAFLRAGRSGGNVETYDFTDIDRTIAAGLALDGKAWDRPHDSIGLAGVRNQASALRLRYLAAGGLGVLTGDGRLPHAGAERLVEAYYRITLVKGLDLTVDYQYVANPAYNQDRGPVWITSIRLHIEYGRK